jgi:EmrB/QacA subfamily drug resistance transporter
MGIGGALIMPATLSIITNVFPPEERAKAISLWAAIAGVATGLGPISGGFLLEHFYWGSIFLVNVPIVAFALIAGVVLIPTSKDPSKPDLDPIGAVLSIVGLVALVYAIIQAPDAGWTSGRILVGFAIGIGVLAAFGLWESKAPSPMLDTTFFKNPRFTAASVGIMLLFFAMFGSIFLQTQYLQFVMQYSALKAGVGLLPMALVMLVVAPSSARLVERWGSKAIVTVGLGLSGISLWLMAGFPDSNIDYWQDVAWRLILMAIGMGLTMAPATESIMGSLPRAKAGVGSAMNDTTRQVGGALGVAIVGSVMSSGYGDRVAASFERVNAPVDAVAAAREGLGQAVEIGRHLPNSAVIGDQVVQGAKEAFVFGLHRGVIVAGAAAVLGALIALRYLPAQELMEPAAESAGDPLADAPPEPVGAD